ncbi:MAG: carboxylate-amine ligase [Planctomycetota bacterium]|jgi:carboxylate-amine ligase
MRHRFNANETHTLGVEIELQLVDAETLALSNSIDQVLRRVPETWTDSFKPEFMQSYCEINTDVCHTVAEVERDLSGKLRWANDIADSLSLKFVWSGTHPFSRWEEQDISPGDRYRWLMETMQDVARRLVVFGLHVHVGVDSGDKAIQMCDRLLRHLPTLLALSANSPLWCGRDTGMMSHRSKIMEALPTAGLPSTLRNWSEYVWLIDHLMSTGFISTVREIWWDVRPHAGFGTVEVRVMDQPMCMRHLLGLVALTQSLVCAISDHIDRGAYQYDCHPLIAKQNKWHACRYGMDASFVDFDTMLAVPARQAARRLIEKVSPFAERLGCLPYFDNLTDLIDTGTGAARQRAVYERTNDPREVVRFLVEQSRAHEAPPEAARAAEG